MQVSMIHHKGVHYLKCHKLLPRILKTRNPPPNIYIGTVQSPQVPFRATIKRALNCPGTPAPRADINSNNLLFKKWPIIDEN